MSQSAYGGYGNCCSGSSNTVDFGANRKRVCDFLLVVNSNLWSYFTPFRRHGNLKAENLHFSLHHIHLTLSLAVNPFKFLDKPNLAKTGILQLSVSEDLPILA